MPCISLFQIKKKELWMNWIYTCCPSVRVNSHWSIESDVINFFCKSWINGFPIRLCPIEDWCRVATKRQSGVNGSVANVPVQLTGCWCWNQAKDERWKSNGRAGPDRQSRNIGFYICFNNKINTRLSWCQAADTDSDTSEYTPSGSCLFQGKIRLNLT